MNPLDVLLWIFTAVVFTLGLVVIVGLIASVAVIFVALWRTYRRRR